MILCCYAETQTHSFGRIWLPCPFVTWKRTDEIQDDLPERDAAKVEAAGGTMPTEKWIGMIDAGAPEA